MSDQSAPELRPGIRTTEFWLSMVVAIGTVVGSATWIDESWAQVVNAIVGLLVAAGYGFQRAQVKKAVLAEKE